MTRCKMTTEEVLKENNIAYNRIKILVYSTNSSNAVWNQMIEK